MISVLERRISAPGYLSKLIGGADMGSFLYLARKRDDLSNEEMSSLLFFEHEITSLCNKYCTVGARVSPALSNVEEVVALVDTPLGIVDGSYIVPYMVSKKEDEDEVLASAQHEFLHIFFEENHDVKVNIINDICPQLQVMVEDNDSLKTSLEDKMVYLYDCLCKYMDGSLSNKRRLKMAEEVVCELASHINSPAKDKVFDMVVNGNWNDNDLFTIFASISTM